MTLVRASAGAGTSILRTGVAETCRAAHASQKTGTGSLSGERRRRGGMEQLEGRATRW